MKREMNKINIFTINFLILETCIYKLIRTKYAKS